MRSQDITTLYENKADNGTVYINDYWQKVLKQGEEIRLPISGHTLSKIFGFACVYKFFAVFNLVSKFCIVHNCVLAYNSELIVRMLSK